MFTAGAESLLRQAREIQNEELSKFCSRVTKLLQKDPGAEAVDALRRLFLIISATKYGRKLEKPCVDLLQTTLCSPTCPQQLQLLCAAILREMAPSEGLALACEHTQSGRALSLTASVLLAQGDRRDEVRSVGRRALQLLEARQPEGPLLPMLSKVVSLAPGALPKAQADLLHRRLVDWLRYASVQQGAAQPSGGFFPAPRARQPGPVTEVDGAVATDFFTVLSTGQHFTEDQRRNVQAFSMLRGWLLLSGPAGTGAADTDDRSELEGSTLSVLSAASASASRLLPPEQQLRAGAFEYCQRILEQSTRRALRRGDADLQKACLVEAVLLLDVLCRQDPSSLYRALSCLKALLGRLCGDPAQARALLPIARFLLGHGEAAAVDSEAVCRHVFSLPAELFPNPMLAFEFTQFCRDSLHLLNTQPDVFKLSFPNLFKLLAWHSPALSAEFAVLLPALTDTSTAAEMFHALLDLPCLTAALDLQLRSLPAMSEQPLWDISVRPTSCLEAFRDPQFQGLFQYLLRTKAGGTIERLASLHRLLQPMASCARVVQCAEAVPTLLQVFFTAVTQVADGALSTQLALAILERSSSLFQVPQYEARVHRVMRSQLLALCQLRPALVVELARDLLDFVGSVGGTRSQESMFTAVVWAVGEYLAVSYDRRCTVEQVNRFFEALEALLFEVTQSRRSAALPPCPPQVITVLMTTLTKLASRSQDLIPRVSLLLSKLRGLPRAPTMGSVPGNEDPDAIHTRATELTNLLKMPSVAQFVFTPGTEASSPQSPRSTRTSLPAALRTVSRLVDREASPGARPDVVAS
ncbi:AP-5 complex subunit zeta-1 [Orycteropus afer afer]|uniref:AP-5 complex subunit zeta-1 n=1 Tax=Orycteropus afer afer TaxID=1230840 RepID=A0A8B6ZZC0_ORYAF|nr:AP-5 complex subunit zeta-1 [Orycteropus afer afer]